MKNQTHRLICLVVLLVVQGGILPLCIHARRILSSSEKLRPAWLANATPVPSNSTFVYQITEGEHRNLNDARASCLINLSTYIKQTNHIQGDAESVITKDNSNGNFTESESYVFTYKIRGEELSITFEKKDEYWEYMLYPNGERVYRCYTLYAVAKSASGTNIDELRFTRKYGAQGFARSLIVPGWGQLHKGNTAKGACILGGEVLLVGGIITAESLRSSYVKKMKENPKHLKTYNTKADNWENIRNVFIGAAASLYVYNLVDALVANGRKRTIVRKAKTQFSFAPVASPEYNGLLLTINF